jgi:hypothetical protein
MIDEFCAASPYSTIKEPAPVPVNRISPPCFPHPDGLHDTARKFALTDRSSGVLDNPLAQRNRLLCEDAKPFDTGPANYELKTGKPGVHNCSVTLRRHFERAQTRSGVICGQLPVHSDFSISVLDLC